MNPLNAALIGFSVGAITVGTYGATVNVAAVLVGALVGLCGLGDQLWRMRRPPTP